jgi:hypothetical protein
VPPGLVLASVGTLLGTPTQADDFSFSVAVSDSALSPGVASANFSVTVASPLQVTTASLPIGEANLPYSVTLAASGGFPPYTWSITQGALPSGLTLNATTGLISGTPTALGMSNFTLQVSDNGMPPSMANASFSIVISPAPARNMALYTTDRAGYQISSNGSLTLLPSSPETAITGSVFGSSPTLPLLFMVDGQVLESLKVNPDYSLTLISSGTLPSTNDYGPPSVDPTGSNLYLPGFIDNSQTTGVFTYPADGSLQPLGSITIPNLAPPVVVFTPDGTKAFVATCAAGSAGSILTYTRASNGMLTPAFVYTLPAGPCADGLSVSPDGKYLAAWKLQPTGNVQVFSIAGDGTLTLATQPFSVTFDPEGTPVRVSDVTWESSGSFLLLATYMMEPFNYYGGVAVLSFSGMSLTESVYPTGGAVSVVRRVGSFVYALETCYKICAAIDGYDFQNRQLNGLPGSPWGYTFAGVGNMVIY